MTDINEVLAFDRDHLWHPYTSMKDPFPVMAVAGASGARITLMDGTELIDGMSSWWCAVHGYRHPALMEAMAAQLGKTSHVMFGGLTHQPAVEAGKMLLERAPEGLNHVFYADSGSVAVEVALKMAIQYRAAKGGKGNARFLALRGGYHGDTLGAMGVSDPENGMHTLFQGAIRENLFAPRPPCRFDGTFDPATLDPFAKIVRENRHSLAAVILEPIVQGAGGMWFYHPEYLKGVAEICEKEDLILIADEIATGFMRTGKYWGVDWAGITPGIMCVGKAFTGGALTGAAVMATSEIALGASADGNVFMHGPTFMANPLMLAAAIASMTLIGDPALPGRIAEMEKTLKHGLEPARSVEGVADVRVLGAIGVIEMERPVNVRRLTRFFTGRGVWLRPFGRLVYVMPPYVIPPEDLETLAAAMADAVKAGEWR